MNSVPILDQLLVPQRFEQLFHRLPIACFCCDTSGQIVEWNHGSELLFSKTFGFVMLRKVWDTIGRSEDAEIVRDLFRGVIAGQIFEGVELSDRTEDGETRHLLCSAFPLRDSDGVITGCVCTCVDISERIRVEQALWESEERWQIALRGNNDGIWDWNLRSRQLFVSQRWKQICGVTEQENHHLRLPHFGQEMSPAFLLSWFDAVHPEDQPSVIHAFQEHLRNDSPFYTSEYRLNNSLDISDGQDRWVLDRGQALRDHSGLIIRVAGSITDITCRKQMEQETKETNRCLEEANQKLAALATQDGLTGLKNHRAFQERLTLEVERAQRHHHPLSLVLLDVDHFKQYNDTYGHPAGDAVLREVARLLESGRRQEDLAGRYGGEEFVLLLPHCAAAEAAEAAERYRTALAAADWPEHPVTVSFGISSLSSAMFGPGDLVTAADQALYAAKRDGRNRIAVV
ncbi:MAG: sensor domain-containing diguanylate cyclase [Janthinobacterium lividum]